MKLMKVWHNRVGWIVYVEDNHHTDCLLEAIRQELKQIEVNDYKPPVEIEKWADIPKEWKSAIPWSIISPIKDNENAYTTEILKYLKEKNK